jgi:hypothetical protein
VPLAAVALMFIIGLPGWMRWRSPAMHRPLGYDELLTLEYYTWAGVQPSGEPQHLRRIGDLHRLGPPTGRQLAVGIYRSLGTWKEPNNHVAHSFLLDAALVLDRSNPAIIRLPALLGSIFFAIIVYWFCGPVQGWTSTAPLAAIWAFCSPYTLSWSQAARGYSLSLALQGLLLLALFRLARRPGSILWGALAVGIAVVTFANIVSLALDWILPVYLAAWLIPPDVVTRDPRVQVGVGLWRKTLLIQVLCIGVVGFVFLIDRLPYVYSSTDQYGLPLDRSQILTNGLVEIIQGVFPNLAWKVFAVLGIAGIVALVVSRRDRTLGAIAVATFVVSLAHFELARRIPYPRACGFYLPSIILGAAYLVERVVRIAAPGVLRLCLWAGLAVATGIMVGAWPGEVPRAELDVASLDAVTWGANPGGSDSYIVLPPDADYLLSKYLNNCWHDTRELPRRGSLNLSLLARRHEGWGVEMIRGNEGRHTWRELPGFLDQGNPTGPYRLWSMRAEAYPLGEGESSEPRIPAFIVWRPDPSRLGLDARDVTDLVGSSGVPYIVRSERIFTKLDFNSRLHSLEFIACSRAEWIEIKELVTRGLRRFGGSALILEPASRAIPPSYSRSGSSAGPAAGRTRRSSIRRDSSPPAVTESSVPTCIRQGTRASSRLRSGLPTGVHACFRSPIGVLSTRPCSATCCGSAVGSASPSGMPTITRVT